MNTRVVCDLKKFLLVYAENVPPQTCFQCTIVGKTDSVLFLNMVHPGNLVFTQKAYDLFRVVDKADGTIDLTVASEFYSIVDPKAHHTGDVAEEYEDRSVSLSTEQAIDT